MPPLSRGLWRPRLIYNQLQSSSITYRRSSTSPHPLFIISAEVQDALKTRKPVVALETTIYTHGFPYPENVALSSQLESLVRVHGAIPATIGILNGVARVGMQAEELIELVSTAGNPETWKISRRDLGFISGLGITGRKLNGGTTIAGTMVLAHLAGIQIFATGGLGGVHRHGEVSMDISADLTELGRTPVTVISSGCKSFLDIPRTLEYLETQGVGVGTFADGRGGPIDFPAFFSRDSGVKSPKVIKDEAEAAAIVFAQSRFPLRSGLLFANPVPAQSAMPKEDISTIIEESVRLADSEGIRGAENTPFVLNKIRELSNGRSVIANRALVEANVIRGAKVAVELAKLDLREAGVLERAASNPAPSYISVPAKKPVEFLAASRSQSAISQQPANTAQIVVAGSLVADLSCDYSPLTSSADSPTPALSTSNPAIISQSVGGVGHNVALAAHYAGARVLLYSAVADDIAGTTLLNQVKESGLPNHGIQQLKVSEGAHTSHYVSVNDIRKDLVLGMADMSIMSSPALQLSESFNAIISASKPKWVVIDTNWSPGDLSEIVSIARNHGVKVAFEPVSIQKSVRIFDPESQIILPEEAVPRHQVNLITPNALELGAIYTAARNLGFFESNLWWRVTNSFEMSSTGSRERLVALTTTALVDQGIPQQSLQLLPFIPNIVTKLGPQGCLLTMLLPPGDPRLSSPESAPYILSRATSSESVVGGVYMRLFPAAQVVKAEDIVSVNGVGDTMLGVLMAGLINEGKNLEDLIPVAQQAAVLTLKSTAAASPQIEGLRHQLQTRESEPVKMQQ